MRVKGDEHYVNMKRKKSKEHTKEKYFLHPLRRKRIPHTSRFFEVLSRKNT